MVRAFIAIPCPDELKKNILEIQRAINKLGKMKLVEPENIHLTLKFLGYVEDNKLNKLIDALNFISENRKFEISLRGIGAFPGPGYVRVIWVGVDRGSDKIMIIQRGIDEKLSSHGFEKDKRFHPHFTLARVRSVVDKQQIRRFLRDNETLEFGSFEVTEINLMESKLSPGGPIYSIIHTFELS